MMRPRTIVDYDRVPWIMDTGTVRITFDCDVRAAVGGYDICLLYTSYHDKKINPMSFLKSEEFLEILEKSCLEKYPYTAFADAFHTMRSMLLPVLYLLGSEVPQADVYHAICTGSVSYTHLDVYKRQ